MRHLLTAVLVLLSASSYAQVVDWEVRDDITRDTIPACTSRETQTRVEAGKVLCLAKLEVLRDTRGLICELRSVVDGQCTSHCATTDGRSARVRNHFTSSSWCGARGTRLTRTVITWYR